MSQPAYSLTKTAVEILEGLGALSYVTAQQLARLFYTAVTKTAIASAGSSGWSTPAMSSVFGHSPARAPDPPRVSLRSPTAAAAL